MATAIHQEIQFDASADKIYAALIDEKEHSAFTGEPAEISSDAGGTFSCYGGQIGGRNIELVPGKRIVQAWRVGAWGEGVYTIVKIELAADGDGTRLVLDHTGVAEDMAENLESGWHARYWEPLTAYLA